MMDWDRQTHPYAGIAHIYEAEHVGWDDDLEMYTAFARRTGSPVLDLGCGSGRVAVPLAVAGFEVRGIDASDALLAIAHGKARDKSVKVDLRRDDMRRFSTDQSYALVLCSLDTFLHLESLEDQIDTLQAVHAALRPGGTFVVDLFHPVLERLAARDGVLRFQGAFAGPGGTTVTHLVAWDVDPAAQTILATHLYDLATPEGALQRRTATMRLRYVHRFELEHALRSVGFRQIELYGDPGLGPFEADSERMIFAATKSS
jgi:SAM-dependent methyltransferase